MTAPTIVVAGAAGDLGTRITTALLRRGAGVRALVRTDAPATDTDRLRSLGADPAPADVADVDSVAAALAGADCVVSALNGLREVVLDRQTVLLDAAVRAGVPRFIPSDYSADSTRTEPGGNRNLDLRREFTGRADRAPIAVTSILNGAFMDMLGAEMPIVQPRIRRVLRIAGETVDSADLAATLSATSGTTYRTLRVGSVGSLHLLIAAARVLAPQRDAVFPAWQGMQYLRDMSSGRAKLEPLDNDRYPDLEWTRTSAVLAAIS